MRLSKNFTLSELTRSSTAKRKGIKNEPTEAHNKNLQRIVAKILQPIRDELTETESSKRTKTVMEIRATKR